MQQILILLTLLSSCDSFTLFNAFAVMDPGPDPDRNVYLPANVRSFLMEEMPVPGKIMYLHGSDCFWNLSYVYDELSITEPCQKFIASVSALVNDARVAANLGPCLYVKPVNGGLGLLSNQCVLNMLF